MRRISADSLRRFFKRLKFCFIRARRHPKNLASSSKYAQIRAKALNALEVIFATVPTSKNPVNFCEKGEAMKRNRNAKFFRFVK